MKRRKNAAAGRAGGVLRQHLVQMERAAEGLFRTANEAIEGGRPVGLAGLKMIPYRVERVRLLLTDVAEIAELLEVAP